MYCMKGPIQSLTYWNVKYYEENCLNDNRVDGYSCLSVILMQCLFLLLVCFLWRDLVMLHPRCPGSSSAVCVCVCETASNSCVQMFVFELEPHETLTCTLSFEPSSFFSSTSKRPGSSGTSVSSLYSSQWVTSYLKVSLQTAVAEISCVWLR